MTRKRESGNRGRTTYVTSHPELDAVIEIPGSASQADAPLPEADPARKPIISINGRDVEELPKSNFPPKRDRAA